LTNARWTPQILSNFRTSVPKSSSVDSIRLPHLLFHLVEMREPANDLPRQPEAFRVERRNIATFTTNVRASTVLEVEHERYRRSHATWLSLFLIAPIPTE